MEKNIIGRGKMRTIYSEKLFVSEIFPTKEKIGQIAMKAQELNL